MRRQRSLLGLLLALTLLFSAFVPASAHHQLEDAVWTGDMCTDRLGCWPRAPVEAPDTCGASELGLHVPVTISGRLLGPLGGIEGGCIYWHNSIGYGSAPTGPLGEFQVDVAVDVQSILYSYHPLYTWDSILIDNPVTQSQSPQSFDVAFLHESSVTPLAFNNSPQKTVTFVMETTAPLEMTRALAEPWGEVIELAYGGPGRAEGWSRMTATAEAPVDAPNGFHRFSSCVLVAGGSGTCSSPGSEKILSPVEPVDLEKGTDYRPHYTIDSVAPVISNQTPLPDHNTLNRSPSIGASVWDPLSGIDYVSQEVKLVHPDGTETVAKGTNFYYPISPLAVGLYTATVTATDLAGNVARRSWEFNITTLSSSAALGRLQEQRLDVNPDGKVVGAPSTVTFRDVMVTLDPYEIHLGPSPYPGYGAFNRTVWLSNAQVTFNNESGIPSKPVNAGLASRHFTAKATSLFNEAGPTTAHIPSSSWNAGSLSVAVPTGYNTEGSTAAIRMVPAEASPVMPGEDSPIPNPPDFSVDPPVVTVATQSRYLIENNGGRLSASVAQGTVRASATINGSDYQIFGHNVPLLPGQREGTFADDPTVSCGAERSECLSNGGLPILQNRAYFEIGSGAQSPIGLYGNHWVFSDAAQTPYLAWSQTSGVVKSTECQGNTKIRPTVRSVSSRSSQLLLEPSGEHAGKSSWRIEKYAFSDLNTRSSGTLGKVKSDADLSWTSGASISNSAQYSLSSAADMDLPNNESLGPISVGYTLKPPSGSAYDGYEQLALGASFVPRFFIDPSNHRIEFLVANEWWIDVSQVACS